VITADQHINDKVVRANKTKVYKLDDDLLVVCGHRRRHLVIDAHRKVLARAHCPNHSIRLKHQDRCAYGSAEEAHPQVQTEASDRLLSRHVSHPRKGSPVKVPSLLLFRICWRSVGVDSVYLRKMFMENRVPLIFWNCWDPLHSLKFQVIFTPCKRDMSKHISMVFPTLHEVRSNYVQTQVCGRTITCLLVRL